MSMCLAHCVLFGSNRVAEAKAAMAHTNGLPGFTLWLTNIAMEKLIYLLK